MGKSLILAVILLWPFMMSVKGAGGDAIPGDVMVSTRKEPSPESIAESAAERRMAREDAALEAERIWNLPYDVAYAYAHGKVAYNELEFDADNKIVYTDDLKAALVPLAAERATSSQDTNATMRIVVLAFVAALLLAGFLLRKKKAA